MMAITRYKGQITHLECQVSSKIIPASASNGTANRVVHPTLTAARINHPTNVNLGWFPKILPSMPQHLYWASFSGLRRLVIIFDTALEHKLLETDVVNTDPATHNKANSGLNVAPGIDNARGSEFDESINIATNARINPTITILPGTKSLVMLSGRP